MIMAMSRANGSLKLPPICHAAELACLQGPIRDVRMIARRVSAQENRYYRKGIYRKLTASVVWWSEFLATDQK
jgi:hypothetical protein